MDLINQSRRYFVFSNPDGTCFDKKGIEATDKEIKFPRCYPDKPNDPVNHDNRMKWTFETVDECLQWYKDNKMDFKAGKRIDKVFHDIQTKSAEITDTDWELMKARMRSPEKFSKEDFRVFEDWLANNWRDRDRDRFPKSFVDVLNKTMPGKSRMMNHDGRSEREGRYFKSRLEKLSIDQALEFIGEHSVGKMKEHLKQVEEKDGGLFVLVPSFYMRISEKNADKIADIDAGIGGDSSIGFRADGHEPVKDKDGNVLYYEFIDNGTSEALEGSDVWLGSQRGSRIRKDADSEDEVVQIKPSKTEHACEFILSEGFEQFKNMTREHEGKKYRVLIGIKDGESKELSYHYNKEVWPLDSAKSHSKDHGGKFSPASKSVADKTKTGVKTMEFKIDSIGFVKEIDVNDDSVSKLSGEIEGKVAEVVNENVELAEAVKGYKETFGDMTADDLAQLRKDAENGKAYKKQLIDRTNKYKMLLGLVENTEEAVKTDKEVLDSLPVDQVNSLLGNYQKLWEKDHPPKGVTPDNLEELPEEKPEDKKEVELYIPVSN